ncbi:MAG: MATE family efflux transporter [Alphaproteobacteria bacterium]|nr:MATE family efflux transporter [Celeribacter baekdonensis]MBU0642904.1 MATE family efflux transporter [Alphaproteobacteria bacterium]MBU1280000.1 MATE family efflux transporter [Alphaproteobacteria bacterium]MBU1575331.1 MATE family efflux transporter [Alphaproteobacteria bacterium]MBU1829441.1 MATE family efflux transporter [Alphaproteobacteria bacterium]MBU2079104.1 MATE family efflux transporter [Alphaproteobacteria bacterium]
MIIERTYMEHARRILVLGLPLAGSQLAQFAVHMTDVIMMGWYGLDELAALVLASGFWFVLFILLAGFAFAVMPLVATAAGRGDVTMVRRATRMAIWLSIIAAVVIYPVFGFSDEVLVALGQQPHIAAMAKPYLAVAGFEMIPALVVAVFRSYFSALERTRVVLIAVICAVGLNALLNYMLIFGGFGMPELGVLGSAIASLIVSTLMMVALAVYAKMATPENDLFRNPFKPDWPMFRTVFRMGVPIGLTSLAEVGLFNAAALMMGWIGTATLAAHGIVLQLTAIAFMTQIGLSQAGTIRAGNAMGRGDEADLRKGARVVVVMSLIMAAISSSLFLLFPDFLIGLFIAPDEPARADVLAIGGVLIVLAAMVQFSDGGQVVALSLLRGVHDTAVPMWLASLSYWGIGLPVSYLFGFVIGWGAEGVWMGFVFGLTSACLLMSYRFWVQKSRISRHA